MPVLGPNTQRIVNELGVMFVNQLTDENKPIMAFGMIPHDQFKPFMSTVKRTIAEYFVQDGGQYEGLSADDVEANLSRQFLNELETEIGKAIYRAAKGMMVV